MRQMTSLILKLLFLPALAIPLAAQNSSPGIEWQRGPGVARLGDQGTIKLPKGYSFTGPEGTKVFMESNQNFTDGSELGILIPESRQFFVLFEFDPSGYIRDDEKASLDADKILESIRAATEKSNEKRKERGWGTLTVLGWAQPPHYDEQTHNLEWCARAKDESGDISANYNTRILGRRGVMSVSLVSDAANLERDLPVFRSALTGFDYTSDNRYSEFRAGDKVAEYGLTALIVGGTAAAATKLGFFKWAWKLLLVGWKFVLIGIAALGGLVKKLFSSRSMKTAEGEQGNTP